MGKNGADILYYLLVVGVGLLSAIVTVILYLIYEFLWGLTQQTFEASALLFVPLAFLAIGGSYTLVRLFADTKTSGSGTHAVIKAYHLTNGEVSLKDALVKPTSAILTIGLGGSAGPEGPSLLAGGGVASTVSKCFRIPAEKQRTTFIAGAAAGLAATFRTPLTAILFALEIPYKNDLDRETLIEAALASIPAYLLSVAVLGSEPFFGVIPERAFTPETVVLSLLLGLVCGFYTLFFTKAFSWAGSLSFRVRRNWGSFGQVLVGASVLSVSGLFSIYTVGVGLHFVDALIHGTAFTALFSSQSHWLKRSPPHSL